LLGLIAFTFNKDKMNLDSTEQCRIQEQTRYHCKYMYDIINAHITFPKLHIQVAAILK